MQKYATRPENFDRTKATSTVHLSTRERSTPSSLSSSSSSDASWVVPPSRDRLTIPVSAELTVDVDFSDSDDDRTEDPLFRRDDDIILPRPLESSSSSSSSKRDKGRPRWLSEIIDVEKPESFCLDEQVSREFGKLLLTSPYKLRTRKEIATDEFSPHNQNAKNELIADAHSYILLGHVLVTMVEAFKDNDGSTNFSGATPEEILSGIFCGFIPSSE